MEGGETKSAVGRVLGEGGAHRGLHRHETPSDETYWSRRMRWGYLPILRDPAWVPLLGTAIRSSSKPRSGTEPSPVVATSPISAKVVVGHNVNVCI